MFRTSSQSYLLEAILYTTCDWGSLVRFDMESTDTTAAANMTHVTQVFISTPSLAGCEGWTFENV